MTKTNFTKAEEALSETLQKLTVQKLLDESPSSKNKGKTSSKHLAQEIQAQHRFLVALKRDLQRLYKRDQGIYKQIGISKKDLDLLLQISEKQSDKEWEKLKLIRNNIDKLLKSLPKVDETTPDDTLLQQQRQRHETKRFNVNEKWLPLS